MNKPVKQVCVDCHFFQRDMPADKPLRFLVTDDQREWSRTGNFNWYPNCNIGCHLGVWDTGVGLPGEIDEVVLRTERTATCFFWPFTPGMQFPAAKILQKRAADQKEAATDRRHTIRGLRIAAWGLGVTALFSLFNFIMGLFE